MQHLWLVDFLASGDACHLARTSFTTPSTDQPLHIHDFHEVFWVDTGNVRQRTTDGDEILPGGTLVCVRPDDAHAIDAADGGGAIVNIAFPTASWNSLVTRYGGRDSLFIDRLHKRVLNHEQLSEVRVSAKALFRGDRSLLALDTFLTQLLWLCLHGDDARVNPAPLWLSKALSRLDDRKFAAAGVGQLVKTCGRSPEHVARCCRITFGKSPTDLVNDARLRHATRLLESTDLAVLDVSADCGFETLSHFYACFSAKYGCAPVAWRKRQRAIVRPIR